MARRPDIPTISSLRVQNFRALRDITLKDITPLTVLVGPNGSGKSTVFDVFQFLADCFTSGLRPAWERRNRFRELRSKAASGPIVFELKYREGRDLPLITYHLEIDEEPKGPVVAREYMQWTRGSQGKPYRFLDFERGDGNVISGELPDIAAVRDRQRLQSADLLAVNTLGQFANHPRVSALRSFISGWYLSYLSAASTRGVPESGPQERLSQAGDNLPNVIQYLHEQHPERLREILATLSRRVPALEDVIARVLDDGRLMLQIRDAPFSEPVLAKFASDGTLKMLAYLTVLYDPEPSPLIGIEEPENQLHPFLMRGLAEECQAASARSQLLITTHSPLFLDSLRPEDVRVLHRGTDGYTRVDRVSDMPGVVAQVGAGGLLGSLWTEGYFTAGNVARG